MDFQWTSLGIFSFVIESYESREEKEGNEGKKTGEGLNIIECNTWSETQSVHSWQLGWRVRKPKKRIFILRGDLFLKEITSDRLHQDSWSIQIAGDHPDYSWWALFPSSHIWASNNLHSTVSNEPTITRPRLKQIQLLIGVVHHSLFSTLVLLLHRQLMKTQG